MLLFTNDIPGKGRETYPTSGASAPVRLLIIISVGGTKGQIKERLTCLPHSTFPGPGSPCMVAVLREATDLH